MFRINKPTGNFARYVSKAEFPTLSLEVSFWGGAEAPGQKNPKKTHVLARCLKKSNSQWLSSPWLEVWRKEFGNPVMPDGAWNGIRLAEAVGDIPFIAISNKLLRLDLNTGETIWSIDTGNTPVYEIMASKNNDSIIVFNGYYGFKDDQNLGNIVALDFDGNTQWRVELPSEDDIFANAPYYEGGILKSSSWQCFNCSINEHDGSITDRIFTK